MWLTNLSQAFKLEIINSEAPFYVLIDIYVFIAD